MKVIIVGGGRVGYYLTKVLIEHGHEPTLVEINRKLCEDLANKFDITVVLGDGTQPETLKSAGAGKADVIVSVTGKDEDNLICCQLAKRIFKVKKVIAKANNPKNAIAMKKLGVDHVINNIYNIAMLIEREVITSRIKQLLTLNNGKICISEVQIPENYALDGIMLKDIKFNTLINIVLITRGEHTIIPRGHSILKSGDKLLVIMENDSDRELLTSLKIKK
jgi:trk system potassium uptake protein TrkA